MRPDPETLKFGLNDFDDPRLQTLWGMLKTPLAPNPDPPGESDVENDAEYEFQHSSDRARRTRSV